MQKNNLTVLLLMIPIAIITAYLLVKFTTLGLALIIGLIIGVIVLSLIIKNPFLGLLLVVFTLPFERIPTLDIGLVTIKLDQIFAGLTLIAWGLKFIFEREKFSQYPISIPILLFILVNIISLSQAQDNKRAVMVFVFVIFMILISLLVTNLINSRQNLDKLVKVILWSTLVVCIFGIYQFLGDVVGLDSNLTGLKEIYTKAAMGFPRIQAFSMEPLYLANLLFIPLGLFSSYYLIKPKLPFNIKYLGLFILLIITIIFLGISRGAYIALAGMVIFFALFMMKKVLTFRNIIITIIGIVLIGGVSYAFLKISRPDALAEFIRHAKVEDYAQGESVQKRLKDFSKAIIFWQSSPIIGIGPGNYGPAYVGYPSHDKVTDWEIVNNQYIETLAETGILGLITLLLVYIIVIWRSVMAYFKTKDQFLRATIFGLLAAFIAILIQYNFFSTLYIMHIWVLIGLMLAVQNLCFGEENEK